MKIVNKLLPLAIIVFVGLVLSSPLAKPGLFTMHDDQQVARLFLYDQAQRDQFPPRWVSTLGFGFGYPLFVFYPPLVYMVGEIFHLTGIGFIDSVKLVFALSILASGIAMFFLLRTLLGKFPALISALFYMVVPYRALDIYVRGALAESFSFVWLPLILLSFYKLYETRRFKYVLSSSIFLALLMITHNLIFLPFMMILPIFLLFLILNSKFKIHLVRSATLVFLLAASLSAFFWLPALLEKKYTVVDDLLLVNLASYKIHFVYPQQLWNWPWGFGGSAPGLGDGISFKIGKIHIIASATALFLALFHLVKKSKTPIFQKQLALLIAFLLLLSAFMTTFYSQLIWNFIKPLAYLQFPWRFLIFTALFSSVLTGFLVYFLRLPILKLIAVIVLALLLLPNFKLFKPQSIRNLTDGEATAKEIIEWDVSQSSFEYLPKGIDLYEGPLGTNLVRIDKKDLPKTAVEVLSGDAQIKNIEETSSSFNMKIRSDQNSKIKINQFNFPGWTAEVDAQKVVIDDNNRLKLITVNIPRGEHKLSVRFENTPIRSLAITVSAVSLMFLFIYFTRWLRKKAF